MGRKRGRWRLSTRIVLSQLAVLLVVAAFGLWLNVRLADDQLNDQYEHRSLAVAQTVADLPHVIQALSGTGPVSAVQPMAMRIGQTTGVAFVVVVNRGGIRLSSPDPALVGKWFHEPVVSLDGRDHLRIDQGKPAPSANACAPVFGTGGTVIGEVSVGFLERQVTTAAWRELPLILAAAGGALLAGVIVSLLLTRRLKRITFGLELEEIAGLLREQESLRRVATLVATRRAPGGGLLRRRRGGGPAGERRRGPGVPLPARRVGRPGGGLGGRGIPRSGGSAEVPRRRERPDRGGRAGVGPRRGDHHRGRAHGGGHRAAHRGLHRAGGHRHLERPGPRGPGRVPHARGDRGRRGTAPDRAGPA